MLNAWAQKHGLSEVAFYELFQLLGAAGVDKSVLHPHPEHSEAAVQQAIRLEVAKRGGRVWRNNSGVAVDQETGRHVRYGLANDSKKVNKVFKSSDLIGITPVTCPCGRKYGVFTAYEVKPPGWSMRPSDKRAEAQFNFIKLVCALGGWARFIDSEEGVF